MEKAAKCGVQAPCCATMPLVLITKIVGFTATEVSSLDVLAAGRGPCAGALCGFFPLRPVSHAQSPFSTLSATIAVETEKLHIYGALQAREILASCEAPAQAEGHCEGTGLDSAVQQLFWCITHCWRSLAARLCRYSWKFSSRPRASTAQQQSGPLAAFVIRCLTGRP